jgi:adenylate cyclase
MAILHLLGAPHVEGLAQASADALVAQPKLLALLAFLVVEGTPGPRRRGVVVDHFWPDATHERGRGSLRSALHILRVHLGARAIRSSGEALIVDSGLECDAVRFQAMIDEGRPGDALTLYTGDFMAGLEGGLTARVTRWIEERRAGLRREAERAAWSASREAERRREWISAVDRARWARSLSTEPEHALRRVMELLDRAGDRVAALREYEAFSEDLERVQGLRPSAETVTLARDIRVGTRAGAATKATRPPATLDRSTIAILPFTIDQPGSELADLAVGLSHEIIDALNRLSGVAVIARGSVVDLMNRRSRDTSELVRELAVEAVLEGSVRLSGDRLQVVARLADGRTGTPIWGDIYEGEREEALAIRARLVLALVEALGIPLDPDEAAALQRGPTSDPEAYRLYLEGRALWNRRSQRAVEVAVERFESALAIDPDFALAHSGIADACLALVPSAGVRTAEARVRVREAARAALAADPRMGEAHATLGLLRAVADHDWSGAEQEFERAIALSPGHASAHHWYGSFLTFVKRDFERGPEELELARELDPHSPVILEDIGMAEFNRGRRPEALLMLRRALALDPDHWRAHYDFGVTSILCGDHEGGTEHLRRAWSLGAWGLESSGPGVELEWRDALTDRLERLNSGRRSSVRAVDGSVLATLLGRHAEAISWLQLASEGAWALVLHYTPVLRPLWGHPGFQALADKMEITLSDIEGMGTTASSP